MNIYSSYLISYMGSNTPHTMVSHLTFITGEYILQIFLYPSAESLFRHLLSFITVAFHCVDLLLEIDDSFKKFNFTSHK